MMCSILSVEAQFRIKFIDDFVSDTELEKKKFASRSECDEAIIHFYSTQVANGYLDFRLDTISRNDTVFISAVSGRKYYWQEFSVLGTYKLNSRTKGKWEKGDPFSTDQITTTAEKILAEYENSGFPFASLRISKTEFRDTLVSALMDAVPGPYITCDSLALKTTGGISGRYVRKYIGFHKGDAYDEAWFRDLEKRLKEIPFLKMSRSPEVLFRKESAIFYLYLEKKRANYFNGVLGIQPNDETQKINLTGDVEVKLVNALNTGEEFYLNWRKLQSQTQDLAVTAAIPYLFDLPLGAEGLVKIYRRDTTFTAVKSALALVHIMRGTNQVRAFIEKNSTDRLSNIPAAGLADVNSSLYGLGLRIEELDYKFNPRSGFGFSVEGAAGRKSTSTQQTVDINTETAHYNQYRIAGLAEVFVPTFRKQALHFAFQGALLASEVIYDNEMYRIGGLRTLRGMDEESINASSWTVFTAEYRLLPEENSCLYLFTDLGWYEYKGTEKHITDTPFGFGAGVNFETGSGVFTINYALGQQFQNPLLVRNGKVSFGFRSVF